MDNVETGGVILIAITLLKILEKVITAVMTKFNNHNGDNGNGKITLALTKQQVDQNKNDIENHAKTFTRVFDKLDEIKDLIVNKK